LKQGKGWMQRLPIHDEVLPGQTVVELLGDCRVLIEHHRGVTEYGTSRIQVRVKFGMVSVCGEGLELCRMTGNQLVITGRIDSISLFRGD